MKPNTKTLTLSLALLAAASALGAITNIVTSGPAAAGIGTSPGIRGR